MRENNQAAGKTWTYAYDDGGKRIMKTVNGTAYNYHYLGDQLVELTWGGNKLHFTYDSTGPLSEMCIRDRTFLKEKRSVILANNNEQAKANQRIMDAAQTLENASLHITEWDESAVRQLVETVKVLSKDEIAVTLKGGIEICQKIMY